MVAAAIFDMQSVEKQKFKQKLLNLLKLTSFSSK